MRRNWIIAPLAAIALVASGTAARADSSRILVPVIVGATVGAVIGAVVVGSRGHKHVHNDHGHGRKHVRHRSHSRKHVHSNRGHSRKHDVRRDNRRHFGNDGRRRGGDVYVYQADRRRGNVVVVSDRRGDFDRRDRYDDRRRDRDYRDNRRRDRD